MRNPAEYISDHLLVFLTLSFLSGIIMACRLSPPEATVTHLTLSLFIFLTVLTLLHFFRRRRITLCLLLPFIAAIGFQHGQLALRLPPESSHIFNRIQEKTEAVIIGTLATAPEFDGKISQVLIEAKHIRFQQSPELEPTDGKVLLHFQGPWPTTLLPGDVLVIRAELKRPDSYRAPGVFDYAQHLARKGVWISGFVRSPLFLQKLKEKHDMLHTLRYLPERIRTSIGEYIDAAVPIESSGLYRAILIGDSSRVDDTTLETFKGSGTFHILSISGLHMTVIFTFLYATLYWLLSRSERLLFRYPLRKWAAFLSIPVLLGYGLLAGLNVPVFRAVIMSCIVIVAICTDRPKSFSTLLAGAALIILIVDPLALLTASFQLSFAATMAILFIFPVLKKLIIADSAASPLNIRQRICNWLIAGILVSTVATLITAPITLFSFNRFSPVGIFANLFVEPLICLWSLPAGFLAIPFMVVQPEIGMWLLRIGSLGLSAAIQGTTFFSSLPFANLWLPSPPLFLMIAFYAAIIGGYLCGKQAKLRFYCSIMVVTVCLLLMLYPPAFLRKRAADAFQLTFLDVGQGSASLAEFPSGMTVLIDGGGSSAATSSVGERVIAPYLWHKGIHRLDAIVLTHPDADHYNGLGFILQHFSPKQLWVRDKHGHDAAFKQLIDLAEQLQVLVVTPQQGLRLEAEGGENFIECVANTAAESFPSARRESRTQANTGIVVKVCSKRYCALFPGDIGRAEEHSLLASGYNVQVDLLLAPHHGSITSNSPEFLSAVTANLMVVSAGRGGRGYFPHPHLGEDCRQQGITLLTTSVHGTLEAVIGPELLQVFGYSKHQNNPLHSYKSVLVFEKER